MAESFKSIGNIPTGFTTGETAKILDVSQQHVIRAFDDKRLKGFRVPGSSFRRIPAQALQNFADHNKMEVTVPQEMKYIVLSQNPDVAATLEDVCKEILDRVTIILTTDTFETGSIMSEEFISHVLVDKQLPEALKILRTRVAPSQSIRSFPHLRALTLLLRKELLCVSDVFEKDEHVPARMLRNGSTGEAVEVETAEKEIPQEAPAELVHA